jgi:hypothetical protein
MRPEIHPGPGETTSTPGPKFRQMIAALEQVYFYLYLSACVHRLRVGDGFLAAYLPINQTTRPLNPRRPLFIPIDRVSRNDAQIRFLFAVLMHPFPIHPSDLHVR